MESHVTKQAKRRVFWGINIILHLFGNLGSFTFHFYEKTERSLVKIIFDQKYLESFKTSYIRK